MNVSILEKYDNLILRSIKNDKLKYVLLMLPYKLPIAIILVILLVTKILSLKFFLVILGGTAILKFTAKGDKYENKK